MDTETLVADEKYIALSEARSAYIKELAEGVRQTLRVRRQYILNMIADDTGAGLLSVPKDILDE